MAIQDTIDIECLAEALLAYNDAKRDHDAARDRHQGPSWGYHGQYEIQRKQEAATEFADRLKRCVDGLVDARLRELGVVPKDSASLTPW